MVLRLAAAEMQVFGVHRDGPFQLVWRECGVDEQMVVAGVRLIDTCRRNAHAGQPEFNFDGLVTISPSFRLMK
jgi:hypothetical protein